jgi:tripartite-type tricarboxylate transporter receptor subunit TctC
LLWEIGSDDGLSETHREVAWWASARYAEETNARGAQRRRVGKIAQFSADGGHGAYAILPTADRLRKRAFAHPTENRREDMSTIARRRFIKNALSAALALGGGTVSALRLMPGASVARAQGTPAGDSGWPSRPVRFIVPLAAGGGLDFVARVVGEHMSRELGQQVVIENRTGAGGTIGIDTAIKSAPDGYSVLITNDNVASAPHVLGLNVDFLGELIPVALLGRQPQALAVHPSLTNVNSVADLVALVKQRPGMGCATSGVGSNQHVLLAWFAREAGIRLDHVPYRGAGQAINDVLAGHVQVLFTGVPPTLDFISRGELVPLLVSSRERLATLPSTPTGREIGMAQFHVDVWFGLLAPAGTPAAIVDLLARQIAEIVREGDTRQKMAVQGIVPVGSSPDEFTKTIREDLQRWPQLIRDAGIKAE